MAGVLSRLVEAVRMRRKARRDARALAMLPDHVLADMGFEKFNVLTGTNDSRDIWVIPHRRF
jgi:hypothetical protein